MKRIIAIFICLACLVTTTPSQAGLSDFIKSFLEVKEARNCGRHNVLNLGTSASPEYVIMNAITTDAILSTSGSIPSWAMDSQTVGGTARWVKQTPETCLSPCEGSVVATFVCMENGFESGNCDDDKPADEIVSCRDESACSSCVALRDWGSPSGTYTLIDGRKVWCDNSHDGGGWELWMQFSSVATARYDGMNLIRNNSQFNARGGTGNAVLTKSTYCGGSGCVLTGDEGLNWVKSGAVGYIYMPLPTGKSETRVAFQHAYLNANTKVWCYVMGNTENKVTLGPGENGTATFDYSEIIGTPRLRCEEDAAIGEIQSVWAR